MKNCMTSGMLSSNTVEWGTPLELFKKLDDEFHFTLDVCASDGMQLCERYYNPETDGLSKVWGGDEVCWMNPPYGKEIIKWVKKASESPSITVALLPARTDTKWYQKYVQPFASEVRFVSGRLKFKGATSSAPFPSMIVIYNTPRTPRYGVIE